MRIFKHAKRLLALTSLCALLSPILTVPAAAAGFQDVPAGHWAAAEIEDCVELGFFKGQSATHFGLGQPMTRAAFAVVLCRFFGWDTPAPTYPIYSDVPVSAWYAGAVETAFTHGALTRQDALFRPDDPITREELTVTLIRAMGYSALSGLAANDSLPFADVSENTGYISLAHTLGLMNGTTATTFSPDRQATREQVAVILMRLYRKLQQPAPSQVAILNALELSPDLSGVSVAAIPAARLLYAAGSPRVDMMYPSETAAALQSACRDAEVPMLLYVTGTATALKDSASVTAAALVRAVNEQNYDGLFLDIPKLKQAKSAALTALVKELRKQLGDKPLFLMAEAPAREGTSYNGYSFAELAGLVDRLVLRIPTAPPSSGMVAIAPIDPLENVYYALSGLTAVVPAEKLSLLMQANGNLWKGQTLAESVSGRDISALLAEEEMNEHYADRYACAYLSGTENYNAATVVWYLNGRAAAERILMTRLLGINQISISDFSTASADFFSGLK